MHQLIVIHSTLVPVMKMKRFILLPLLLEILLTIVKTLEKLEMESVTMMLIMLIVGMTWETAVWNQSKTTFVQIAYVMRITQDT